MFESESVVVSAHFDDAVLCLGGALAASAHRPRVVTVAGARPPESAASAAWDELAGFESGARAAEIRAAEDLAAADLLGFSAIHLGFLDAPYAPDPWPVEHLVSALTAELADVATVYVPAGLGEHPDHLRTRDCALLAAAAAGVAEVRIYADLPYAMVAPRWGAADFHLSTHAVLRPLDDLAGRWRLGEPEYRQLSDAAWSRKRAAVLAYASQMAPLAADFPGFMARSGPLSTEAIWPVTASAARDAGFAPAGSMVAPAMGAPR